MCASSVAVVNTVGESTIRKGSEYGVENLH